MSKMDAWAKKYEVKMIASATVPSEHLFVMIGEAPNFEALQKVAMEPEAMAMATYNTTEVKLALSTEESMKMMQQMR
jgi:hypothetical protein